MDVVSAQQVRENESFLGRLEEQRGQRLPYRLHFQKEKERLAEEM